MKKLIINCDDMGISKQTNIAIVDCLNANKATSASILSNGKHFLHAVKQIKKNKKKFFGVHLNLTEGKALNIVSNNILTDTKNNFIHGPGFFFLNNFTKDKNIEKIIYLEFKKQILNVVNSGIKISHLDSHQHIHHVPFIFKIIVKLAKEFRIKKIRRLNEKFVFSIFLKNFFYKLKSSNYIKFVLIKLYTRKLNYFKSTDFFYGILNSGKINLNEFFQYVDKIDENKTIELCIHPSHSSSKNSNKYSKFYSSINRSLENRLLFSDNFKKELKKRKIKLINFNSL